MSDQNSIGTQFDYEINEHPIEVNDYNIHQDLIWHYYAQLGTPTIDSDESTLDIQNTYFPSLEDFGNDSPTYLGGGREYLFCHSNSFGTLISKKENQSGTGFREAKDGLFDF